MTSAQAVPCDERPEGGRSIAALRAARPAVRGLLCLCALMPVLMMTGAVQAQQGGAPYVCDVNALQDGTHGFGNCGLGAGGCCYTDADGNGVVNPADRGFVSANIGTTDFGLVCLYDMNGDGFVNAGDRGFIAANVGQCHDLSDFQNGSGLNNGVPDPRYPHDEPCYASNQWPTANAGPNRIGQSGVAMTFDRSGSTDPDGYLIAAYWDFGDNQASGWITSTTVQHTYQFAGPYTVYLWVQDNCLDYSDYDTASVTIAPGVNLCLGNDPPNAYGGLDKAGRECISFGFSGSGSTDPDGNGTIVSYHWDFDDGQSSDNSSTSHTYATPGTYYAVLTVTDDCDATDEDTVQVTVSANQLPTANAGPNRTVGIGVSTTYSATGSSDPDGSLVGYSWDFGNGQVRTGATVSYAYPNAGDYNVVLTVTDDCGDTRSDTALVHVNTACDSNQLPTANAGLNQNATTGQSVSFSGSASSDPDGTLVSYAWNFGDSTAGSGVNVSHTYAAAATYTVTLTVTDNCGGTRSDTATVQVTQAQTGPVSADFTWTPANPQTGDPVTFTPVASEAQAPWRDWQFSDDGRSYDGFHQEHRFFTSGTHSVTLMVWDPAGNSYTHTRQITVVDGLRVKSSPPVLQRTYVQDIAINPAGMAFVANPVQGIVTVDVSDPAMPVPVAVFQDLPGYPSGIQLALVGNLLYFVTQDLAGANFGVLDVTNPTAPQMRSFVPVPGVYVPVELVVSGAYAYAANGDLPGSFSVFNISQTTAVSHAGTYPLSSKPNGLSVANGKLGIATEAGNLVLYSLANPAIPTPSGVVPLGNPAKTVEMSGQYAYVGTANTNGAQLKVVTIPATGAASVATTVSFQGGAADIALDGNHAYVSGGGTGLAIVNIATPSSAYVAGIATLGGGKYGLAVRAGTAWVCGQLGLFAINISSPSTPSAGAAVRLSYDSQGSVLVGTMVWAAGDPGVLTTVDVSNPNDPHLISTKSQGAVYTMAASSSIVAAAAGNAGVLLFDATDPEGQTLLGSYPGYQAMAVAFVGSRLYVGGSTGLRVLDVSVPAHPTLRSTVATNLNITRLLTVGTTVYAADYFGGFHVFNAQNADAPGYVRAVSTQGNVLEFGAFGSLLGISGSTGRVQFFSLTQPQNPAFLSELPLDSVNTSHGLAMASSRAYVSVDRRIYEIDTTNALQPIVTESVVLEQRAENLSVSGSLVYAGLDNMVLTLLDR